MRCREARNLSIRRAGSRELRHEDDSNISRAWGRQNQRYPTLTFLAQRPLHLRRHERVLPEVGSSRTQVLNLKPRRCNADLRAISGFVSELLMARMFSERREVSLRLPVSAFLALYLNLPPIWISVPS